MELKSQEHPARKTMSGSSTVEIPAGQVLKIETTPGGAEVLDATVPEGKKWTVNLNLDIVEENI